MSKYRKVALAAAALAMALVASSLLLPETVNGQVPPNRFFCTDPGCVTVAGSPAPEGTNITATIGGVDCGQTTVQADGTYVLDVLASGPAEFEPFARPGCGTEGATVIFTVAGHPAGSATWHSGYFTELDLAAGPVGGIAELPDIGQAPAQQSGAPADGSGWSAGDYAALAGGLVAAVLALTAGAWYARRRWLR